MGDARWPWRGEASQENDRIPTGGAVQLAKMLKRQLRGAERSRAPKHVQLSASISDAIKGGTLKPGDKLPTELELVRLTPFSLGTVQRAVRSLVENGLVERKQRLGTFVAEQRSQIPDPYFQFLDDDGKSQLPVFTKVVARNVTKQRGPWSDVLRNGGTDVIRIDRLINVNDDFRAYSRFFIDAKRFAGLLDIPLKDMHGANLRALLAQHFHVRLGRLSRKISIRESAGAIAKKINAPDQALCLTVEILAFDNDDCVLYYQELTVPPTRRKLLLQG